MVFFVLVCVKRKLNLESLHSLFPQMEDNTYLTDPTDTKGLVVSTLPPLKWYEFYEIRAVGKVLGGLLSLGGIASIASAFFKLRNAAPAAKAAVFVSGTVSFVLGIIMQRRKYWKDPIAVAEYRRAIATSRLSHSLKEFGWDGVLRGACISNTSTDIFLLFW